MSSPSTPGLTAASTPAGPLPGRLIRRLLITMALAVIIAATLWLVSRHAFVDNLVYSLCIGLLCELFLDGGRRLVARWISRHDPHGTAARTQWPGWPWMLSLVLAGVPAAYGLGHLMGDLLTGRDTALVEWRPHLAMMMISLGLALSATLFFKGRGELMASRAAAEAAHRNAVETRLKLLESQLEPHMLFNTLANLKVLIDLDPQQAQTMLDHLIDFLRATLQGSRATTHCLATEFTRLQDYLALMSVRMGPRLVARFDLPDALRDAAVPALLLQPLVENAIKHGLEPHVDGGRLHVQACTRPTGPGGVPVLCLSVRDTGAGLKPKDGKPATSSTGTGFGLGQVRERLATLYGPSASLRLSPAGDAEGGTLAEIEVPLSRFSLPAPADQPADKPTP